MARRNSSFKLGQKKANDSPRFYDEDLDDGFDADQNPINHNPFSAVQPAQSTSKWSLNESWRKLTNIIENKDKQTNQPIKKEINQELLSFSNDEHVDNLLSDYLDYTVQEGQEIQEGDISYVDSSSDLSEEKESSIKNLPANNNINFNIPTTNSTFYTTTTNLSTNTYTNSPSSITPSTSSTKLDGHKKDDSKDTKTHTFLFSKIKKNSSIEQLNDLEDKDNEKEFDKRSDLGKPNDLSNKTKCSPQVQFKQQHQQQTSTTPSRVTPIKSTIKQMNKTKELNNISESSSNDAFNAIDSSTDFLRTIELNRPKQQRLQNQIDEPLPSMNDFMSFIVNLFRQRFNFFSVTSSFCIFFISIFAIQLSPLSSFANGFLIGIIFSVLFLLIVVVYGLNFIFQKIDRQNDLHARIMSGERWKKYPAYKKTQKSSNDKLMNTLQQQQNEVHEGWFFELVYSKKLGVDRLPANEKFDYDKMPETKLQLTYIKLESTIMRVYVPKPDQSKKLKPDMDGKVNNFLKVSNKMNQHIYDFSKMNIKKLHLWLPKNIRNRKKYLWSRKYPFILVIEETNKLSVESKRVPFNLILFARTNREKEQWYNKFKQSIEMAEQNLSMHHLSTTAASTPDEVTHDNESESLPRAKSLDINISYEFEHLSNFLNYETFIQDLLAQNLSTSGSSGQLHNNSNQSNDQQNYKNLFWFNALVGRVFFDFLTHPHWTRWVQLKIQRKLSRVKLPYFIQTIQLTNVNLGTSFPKFLNVANNPTIDDKGIWIDFDLDYQGCFSMTLETKLDLMKLKETKAIERELKPIKSPVMNQSATVFDYDDLSDPESVVSLSDEDSEENLSIENDVRQARFVKLLDKLVVNKYFQQVSDTKYVKKKMEDFSNLPILLTVNIYRLKGVLTVNLPPAPTDRIWYGFREISEFQLESKPALGERSVSLGPITQFLSKKLKQEFYKNLVYPNLDDIVLGNVMMGIDDIDVVDEVP